MIRVFLNIALAAGVLAAGFLGFRHLRDTKAEITPTAAVEHVWTVRTVPARYSSLTPDIIAYGQLVAGRSADLRPLVAGELVEVSDQMLEGAAVRAGDTLAIIDRFEFELARREAEAQLAEAEGKLAETRSELEGENALLATGREQMRLTQRDLNRRSSLATRGAGSTASVDEASMRLNDAERYVAQREQAIARITSRLAQQDAIVAQRRAAVDRAVRNLRNTVIAAPVSGYLSNVRAAIGMRVSTSDQLASIIDKTRLEVRFELPNRDFARLIEGSGGTLVGREATVRWQVGESIFTYRSTIDRVDSRIDAGTGGIGLFATLDPESIDAGAPIRPGAFVEVVMPDLTFENVMELPDGAVSDAGDVFTVTAESRLAVVPVRTLRRVGRTLIVTGDIAPGTPIVTSRFPEIGPGAKVQIR